MPLISSLQASMQRLLRRTSSVRSEKVCTSLVIPNKRHSLLVETKPPPSKPPPAKPPPSPPVRKPMALGTVNAPPPAAKATPASGTGSVRYPSSADKGKAGGHVTSGSVRYKDRERHHRTQSQTRRQPKQVNTGGIYISRWVRSMYMDTYQHKCKLHKLCVIIQFLF